MAGSALAGTTTVGTVVSYAREVAAPNAVYTVPTNPPGTVRRTMNVIRSANDDFFLDVALGNGAQFATTTGTAAPEGSDLSLVNTTAGAITASVVSRNSTSVIYFVDITTSLTDFPQLNLDTSAWTIKDVNNSLGQAIAIQISITTRDSLTGSAIDVGGTDTRNWLVGRFGVTDGAVSSTQATIDVTANRKLFVAVTGGDSTNIDRGASIIVAFTSSSVLGLNGASYTTTANDTVNLVITGNLAGVTAVHFGSGQFANSFAQGVTDTDRAAGQVTIPIAADPTGGTAFSQLVAGAGIAIRIDTTTQLATRVLKISSNFVSGLGGGAGAATQNHAIHSPTTLTQWCFNGTILLANWVNGNHNALLSRIYVFNSGTISANVTARVFALPNSTNTATTLLKDNILLGTIGPSAGRNIKVADDVLFPSGISSAGSAYVTDGGNLIIEITIDALGASGYTQSFNAAGTLAFGTAPLFNPPACPTLQ